jgi:hypothetical protein
MECYLRAFTVCLLAGQLAGAALAGTPDLTLQGATKIAKQQAVKDRLPAEHLIVELIAPPNSKHRFCLARFEPPIPDQRSKDPNAFIAYIVEMDGSIKRTTIVRTIQRSVVKLPKDLGAVPSGSPSNGLLEKPYRLTLNPSEPTASP